MPPVCTIRKVWALAADAFSICVSQIVHQLEQLQTVRGSGTDRNLKVGRIGIGERGPHQGTIGYPYGIGCLQNCLPGLIPDGRQIHAVASAAFNLSSPAKSHQCRIEQREGKFQLIDLFTDGLAGACVILDLVKRLGHALRQHALAARQIDGRSIVLDLGGDNEIHHQLAQVHDQEQANGQDNGPVFTQTIFKHISSSPS